MEKKSDPSVFYKTKCIVFITVGNHSEKRPRPWLTIPATRLLTRTQSCKRSRNGRQGLLRYLVRRGRREGKRGRLSSFLLPIVPRASLDRASLANKDIKIQRRRLQRERQKKQ